MGMRKGIILAGGSGKRLLPLTLVMSKQLLPVYDKPMIYYSLSTLMLADIREILLISTAKDLPKYRKLLGKGEQWGIKLDYLIQANPEGIAQAFILAESFLDGFPSALVLGDNIFYGPKLSFLLKKASKSTQGASIFAHFVPDPQRYGIVEWDINQKVLSIEEKPTRPKSNYAITGLYFYDSRAVELVKTLKPSARGELEITDLNNLYLQLGSLGVHKLDNELIWFDTGTFESLTQAICNIKNIQTQQGIKIACLEEIALQNKWIDTEQLRRLALPIVNTEYGRYLMNLIK